MLHSTHGMNRTRIKICGVTRPEDAIAAARAGADAIGMAFYEPAPRYVSPERARQILAALPPFVTPVGVFVDASADHVTKVATGLGLRHVQLNGDESPGEVARLRRFAVVKAVRVDRNTFRATLDRWRAAVRDLKLSHLRGLVLEPAHTGQPGGTGVPNDWETVLAEQRAGGFDGLPPLIAAGGLRPETVADVVRGLRPWAVDVSSGVEEVRGIKSAAKLDAFVAAVRDADAGG